MRSTHLLIAVIALLACHSPLDAAAGWRCRTRILRIRQPVCPGGTQTSDREVAYETSLPTPKFCATQEIALDAEAMLCIIDATVCLGGVVVGPPTSFVDQCANWEPTTGACDDPNCKVIIPTLADPSWFLQVGDVSVFPRGSLASEGMPVNLVLSKGWDQELVTYQVTDGDKPLYGYLITRTTATRILRFIIPTTTTDTSDARARDLGRARKIANKADVLDVPVDGQAVKVVAYRAQ